jgi:ABC-type transport system substrate-binding protein
MMRLKLFLNIQTLANVLIALGIAVLISYFVFDDNKLTQTKNAEVDSSKIETSVVLPYPLPIENLDPGTAVTIEHKALLSLVYSPLMSINGSFQVEPELLERWTYDSKNNSYTLFIRENATFNNGQPVTSDDVVYSFHQWMNPGYLDSDTLWPIDGFHNFRSGVSRRIVGVSALNNKTVLIKLSTWVDHFIQTLSNSRFVVFPKNLNSIESKLFYQRPIGSGPYKVIKITSNSLQLERYDGYFKGRPLTQTLNVETFPLDEAVGNFQAGNLSNLAFYSVYDLPSGSPFGMTAMPSSGRFTTFILTIPPITKDLKNIQYRKFIADKIKTINYEIDCFRGATKTENLIPIGIIGGGNSIQQPIEIAKPSSNFGQKPIELLAEANFNVACIRNAMTAKDETIPFDIKEKSLQELFGLLSQKKLTPWFESVRFKGDDPISILQYFNRSSPEYFLQTTLPKLDRLFSRLRYDLSPTDRTKIYREIEEFLIVNYYVVPLFNRSTSLVYDKRLFGLEVTQGRIGTAGWHKIYQTRVLK